MTLETDPQPVYSQSGEDIALWKVFNQKRDGYFIDVGAFDGIHLSNSYLFEQNGWRGLCVEAHPEFFPMCEANRPKSTCINAAAVGNSEINTITFQTEHIGLLSGIDIRFDEDELQRRYAKRGLDFTGLSTVTVPAKTLEAMLDEHLPNGQTIDFVSIDVEGTELDVLKGLNVPRYRPQVIVIEANTEEEEKELTKYLEAQGYFKARRIGANICFTISETLRDRFIDLSFSIDVKATTHPLGEQYTGPMVSRDRRLVFKSQKQK